MSASPPGYNRVVKRGVILTCYVDGRKRFKAVPIDDNRQELREAFAEPDRRSVSRAPVVRVRQSGDESG